MTREHTTFEVLRVASPEVLGETIPLTMPSPCQFKNAQGSLRDIESIDQIRETARKSARDFLAALKAEKVIA